eukprot:TRINITY_DN10798_c0_g1_i11.p1 TRINITY_DN10798_c0_g1~~TRINITY_DN10798_c0_g1_i11.p1  ORF type:complete len:233 (+),score=39.70 TRINITY_DN10798_c0_g1_i11:963-1661(+)
MHEKYTNCELEITALNDCEDDDLAFMSKKIETILKTIQVNKSRLSSDHLAIKVQTDKNLNALEDLMAIKLISVPFTRANKPVTLNECAVPTGHWLCSTCDGVTSEALVQCAGCGSFRLYESLRNAAEAPGSATKQEVELLQLRRVQERNLICGRDLLSPEVVKMDACWYLISVAWLAQWKAFIFNRPCKGSYVSSNPLIGVLPPGPISNHSLFLKGQQTLRPHLKRVLPPLT